jgi:hypothetical protein
LNPLNYISGFQKVVAMWWYKKLISAIQPILRDCGIVPHKKKEVLSFSAKDLFPTYILE